MPTEIFQRVIADAINSLQFAEKWGSIIIYAEKTLTGMQPQKKTGHHWVQDQLEVKENVSRENVLKLFYSKHTQERDMMSPARQGRRVLFCRLRKGVEPGQRQND